MHFTYRNNNKNNNTKLKYIYKFAPKSKMGKRSN